MKRDIAVFFSDRYSFKLWPYQRIASVLMTLLFARLHIHDGFKREWDEEIARTAVKFALKLDPKIK